MRRILYTVVLRERQPDGIKMMARTQMTATQLRQCLPRSVYNRLRENGRVRHRIDDSAVVQCKRK